MEENMVNGKSSQFRCRKCGKFLETTGFLLCDSCYEQFMKWSSRRYLRLSRVEENPIGIWLRETKERKE